jgi:hypothetical protein
MSGYCGESVLTETKETANNRLRAMDVGELTTPELLPSSLCKGG